MEISKLHNGDLVYGLYQNEEDEQIYKTVCKVLGYDPFNSFLWVESKDGIDDFIGFEPIPLTEDILLKCGFEFKGGIGYKSPNNEEHWYFSTGNGFIPNALNHRNTLKKDGYIGVYYLHQLQNLYFALTTTELEINL
jgi:hypothetical protein